MADDFDTYNDDEHGIWQDSDAVRSMRSMMIKATPSGLSMTRMCEQCSVEVNIEIPWVEMFCVSIGVSPEKFKLSRWAYSNKHHVLHPVITCPRCDSGVKPCIVFFPMTPAEAKRHVQAASNGNLIDPQQRNMMGQVQQKLQQAAGQQPRR